MPRPKKKPTWRVVTRDPAHVDLTADTVEVIDGHLIARNSDSDVIQWAYAPGIWAAFTKLS